VSKNAHSILLLLFHLIVLTVDLRVYSRDNVLEIDPQLNVRPLAASSSAAATASAVKRFIHTPNSADPHPLLKPGEALPESCIFFLKESAPLLL
tara:strand:- start:147 stop:428 length:282 start_codon:yes stop_codon:yes gene_type:complete